MVSVGTVPLSVGTVPLISAGTVPTDGFYGNRTMRWMHRSSHGVDLSWLCVLGTWITATVKVPLSGLETGFAL